MAKKGQTTKKAKTETVSVPTVQDTNFIVEGESDMCTSTLTISGEETLTVDENAIIEATIYVPSQVNHIKSMNLEELMWVEKACALICKRHETSARIDFENNKKLTQFSQYYKEIMNELEKRVIKVCEIS